MSSLSLRDEQEIDGSYQTVRSIKDNTSIVPLTWSISTVATAMTDHQCRVVFKDFEYLPWDNPDNIITLETGIRGFKVLCGVVMPLLSFFGVFANMVNGLVFWRQGIRERINLLLFCLACADFVVVVYMFMHSLEYFFTLLVGPFQMYGPLTVYIANARINILYGFVYASGFLSTMIAVERCLCITHPFTAKKILQTKVAGIIVVVCTVALVGVHSIVSDKYRILCEFYPNKGFMLKGYFPSQFYLDNRFLVDVLNGVVYGLALPIFCFLTTTVTTVITAVKLRSAATWRRGQTSAAEADSKEVAVTRMLIAVSCVFIVCSVPNIIFRITPFFLPEFTVGGKHQNLVLLGLCLLHSFPTINSSINFIFYFKMGVPLQDGAEESVVSRQKERKAVQGVCVLNCNFVVRCQHTAVFCI